MSEQIIRVAIAGQGRSGYGIHANYLKFDPRFKVVAVADELPGRCDDAVKQFGCAAFKNYQELLEKAPDFDLFVNATPSRFHVEASLAAIASKRCKYLLTEKPSAPTVAQFDQIVAASKAAGVRFFPFQNSRFYPFFTKIREVLDSGVLGEIVYIRSNWSGFARRWDWQTRQDQLAGNLFNTGPHPVDQAVVLFGDEYPTVHAKFFAHHWEFPGDAENFALLRLSGPNRPTIDIDISSFQAYALGDMYNISGTLGGLTGGPTQLKWKYFDPKTAPHHDFWKPWSDNRSYCSEKLDWHEETWEYKVENSNNTGFSDIVSKLYGKLYDSLFHDGIYEITHDQVRRQVYIMEEAHKQNPLPTKPLC